MNETIQKEIAFLESLLAELYFVYFITGIGLDKRKFLKALDIKLGNITGDYAVYYIPATLIKIILIGNTKCFQLQEL